MYAWSVVRGRLEETDVFELAVLNAAVEQPVTFEQLMVVRATGDVGLRSPGGCRQEADAFDAGLDAGPGEDRRPEDRLDDGRRHVIGEPRDGVRPHGGLLAVPVDEPPQEPPHVGVVRAPLIDPGPAFELLEAPDVLHERGR